MSEVEKAEKLAFQAQDRLIWDFMGKNEDIAVWDEDYPHDQDLYKPKPYCDRCGRKLKEDVHD